MAVKRYNGRNWKSIALQIPGRNDTQCLQRWRKAIKPGLTKVCVYVSNVVMMYLKMFRDNGRQQKIINYGTLWRVEGWGNGQWWLLKFQDERKKKRMQEKRNYMFVISSRQCRERWFNHLDPIINKG